MVICDWLTNHGSKVLASCLFLFSLPLESFAKTLSAEQPAAQPSTDRARAVSQPSQSSPASMEILLQEARRLVESGLYEQAYRTLSLRSAEFAGNPRYDYWLGISALESKRPGQAVFALERVVAAEPNNASARAELARALFMLRELQASKTEFNTAQSSNPPAAALRTMQRYLDAIEQLERDQIAQTRLSGELGFGYDSNTNNGSAQSEWILADGARLIPTDSSRGQSGNVVRLSAGVEHQRRLSTNNILFAQAGLTARQAFVGSNVSFVTVDASLGVVHTRQSHSWTGAISLGHTQVDGNPLRGVIGGAVQWQRSISKSEKLGLFLQTFRMEFPNSQSQNASRHVIGASYGRDTGQGVAWAGVLGYTTERSKVQLSEFNFRGPSLRFFADTALGPSWRGQAQLSLESRRYDGVQLLFEGLERRDNEIDVRLSAERKLGRKLSVVPNLNWTRNASTIGPNDFKRLQIGISIKYRD